ncbi:uncharacterized protein LOC107794200 [Nicotiana tabacum]|uniref:Uncharacterized protein LOC107794200 n=2 Tax=Nicotiana TaxID=4085 RepID=A0A1S4A683_TOBAC|nr:PREDICTED: uncharacterized protein LOC104242238 [Nicotiana sylvestris]XP_016472158.1 PREDICTED: uncharacterized protein LOC107794200 [Nicotiana tabacum]
MGTKVQDVKLVDYNSSFHLYASDNLGMLLTSCLLDGTNYATWSRPMKNVLRSKNKLGFVNGVIKKPSNEKPEANLWETCNSMIILWIFNSLDKTLHSIIAYAETAREVWIDLEERFAQGRAPRIYQIRRDISLLIQDGQTVLTYYTKLKALWDELNDLDPLPECNCVAR